MGTRTINTGICTVRTYADATIMADVTEITYPNGTTKTSAVAW